jgi:F0F1-type ATP synthase assembly protein I
MVNALYVGEALKWALTFALFGVVFINTKPLDAVALMSTFALTQLAVPLLALLVIQKR